MDRILLVGATGLVGGLVAARLPHGNLSVLARRVPEGFSASDPNALIGETADWSVMIANNAPNVLISCLGTTIKAAGSRDAFRSVDHDLVLAVATAAQRSGARHMIAVSSVGASAKSTNFYLKTKGEMENGLRALDFDRLDIIRPGLLTGERQGAARWGEAMAIMAAPFTDMLMHGAMRRYRSAPAATVAAAIAALAKGGGTGNYIHEHDAIVSLAG